MPIYSYECSTCNKTAEEFHRMAERHTHAPVCHGPMGIVLQPNMGYVQRDCHYECPVTRQPVTTNRQRANIMAEHRLIDANDFKPAPRIAREEAALQHRQKLAATLKNPLPDKEMRKLLPSLPGQPRQEIS
jgi:putative FmdB family regulatory protein